MSDQMDLFMVQFNLGDRVEIAPHIDRWMKGDVYGNVVKVGRKYIHVKMDRSGGIAMMAPENLKKVEM